jgi:hypothetical protein
MGVFRRKQRSSTARPVPSGLTAKVTRQVPLLGFFWMVTVSGTRPAPAPTVTTGSMVGSAGWPFR